MIALLHILGFIWFIFGLIAYTRVILNEVKSDELRLTDWIGGLALLFLGPIGFFLALAIYSKGPIVLIKKQ